MSCKLLSLSPSETYLLWSYLTYLMLQCFCITAPTLPSLPCQIPYCSARLLPDWYLRRDAMPVHLRVLELGLSYTKEEKQKKKLVLEKEHITKDKHNNKVLLMWNCCQEVFVLLLLHQGKRRRIVKMISSFLYCPILHPPPLNPPFCKYIFTVYFPSLGP